MDFIRNHGFKMVLGLVFLITLILFFYLIKFDRNLSHLDLTLYSGPQKGNYYAIADSASRIAAKKKGQIKNI